MAEERNVGDVRGEQGAIWSRPARPTRARRHWRRVAEPAAAPARPGAGGRGASARAIQLGLSVRKKAKKPYSRCPSSHARARGGAGARRSCAPWALPCIGSSRARAPGRRAGPLTSPRKLLLPSISLSSSAAPHDHGLSPEHLCCRAIQSGPHSCLAFPPSLALYPPQLPAARPRAAARAAAPAPVTALFGGLGGGKAKVEPMVCIVSPRFCMFYIPSAAISRCLSLHRWCAWAAPLC